MAQVVIANIYRGRQSSSHATTGGRTTTIMSTKGIVAEDPQAAVKWCRKASELGCERLQQEVAQKSIRELAEELEVEETSDQKVEPRPKKK